MQGGGERVKRDRERKREIKKVAGFALKPRLCQTCATAAATPLCVFALAERRTHQAGEGGEGSRGDEQAAEPPRRTSANQTTFPRTSQLPSILPCTPTRRASLPSGDGDCAEEEALTCEPKIRGRRARRCACVYHEVREKWPSPLILCSAL